MSRQAEPSTTEVSEPVQRLCGFIAPSLGVASPDADEQETDTMKIAAISTAALVLAGAAAVATPSLAQPYPGQAYGYGYAQPEPCAARQHDAGVNGAVLGGLAGALLGSSVVPHNGQRAGGAAIGAIAGAVLGNNIARSNANASDTCRARDYGYVRYRATGPYGGYAPYGASYYRDGDRPYRHFTGYDAYSY
jgi:hypothetical protein